MALLRSERDLRFKIEKRVNSLSIEGYATHRCLMRCRHAIHPVVGQGYITRIEDVPQITASGRSMVEAACDAAAMLVDEIGWRLEEGVPLSGSADAHSLDELFEWLRIDEGYSWDADMQPQDFIVYAHYCGVGSS